MRGAERSLRRALALVLSLMLAVSITAAVTANAKSEKTKPDTDEVTNTIVTGGPVHTEDPDPNEPGANAVDIPLSQETFTQMAGEVLMVSAIAEVSGVEQEAASCDLSVVVEGVADPTWNFGLYDMFQLARRGDGGDRIDHAVIPAPTTDRTYDLVARAQENEVDPGIPDGCTDDQFTVSVTITFTTLRD